MQSYRYPYKLLGFGYSDMYKRHIWFYSKDLFCSCLHVVCCIWLKYGKNIKINNKQKLYPFPNLFKKKEWFDLTIFVEVCNMSRDSGGCNFPCIFAITLFFYIFKYSFSIIIFIWVCWIKYISWCILKTCNILLFCIIELLLLEMKYYVI